MEKHIITEQMLEDLVRETVNILLTEKENKKKEKKEEKGASDHKRQEVLDALKNKNGKKSKVKRRELIFALWPDAKNNAGVYATRRSQFSKCVKGKTHEFSAQQINKLYNIINNIM